MRTIKRTETVAIPSGVTVNIKSREVTVSGPRGSLTMSFKHIKVELLHNEAEVTVVIWHGSRKDNALVQTVASKIKNMINGVTLGYRHKMKAAYAHFPINMTVTNNNKTLEIRNFLGDKYTRIIDMIDGVSVSTGGKDEIIIEGISLDDVSLSAAKIHQSAIVKNKDIRKFLDGIYIHKKGSMSED